MTSPMPSDLQLAAAARFGRRFAENGRPIEECPYDANGTPGQRVLARRFVRGYLAAGGK